jgi:acetylornithine deacetylase/succinyl-diaminopimelate desuccinylase-like protein
MLRIEVMLNEVLATIAQREHQSIDLLKQFLSIPSISTDPAYAADVRRCAHWLADQLKYAMLDVSVMETAGHPCVVAKNKHVAGRPTYLIYGHYDVQPPEPLELWTSPAFEPVIRKNNAGHNAVYARGAVDDKGQLWAHVEALTAWQAHGGPPVNVIILIEGEEEIGSPNLGAFIAQHREQLQADICVISDTNQFARGHPAITTGLRGLVYQEMILTGPARDLHSGLYGGAVSNPGNVLSQLIASLHDADGRVTVPGFYDDVIEPDPAQRDAWRKLPFDESAYLRELNIIRATGGEKNYSILERCWARPTCDVNGITYGYQGAGAKTVIGSQASAKISFRLVAHQNPSRIRDTFQQMMRSNLPDGIRIAFTDHGTAPAYQIPLDHPAISIARRAIEIGFGKSATLVGSGGSIPIAATLQRELGIECLFIGFGLPDDCIHSPNEKFDLDCLSAGTRTVAALLGA